LIPPIISKNKWIVGIAVMLVFILLLASFTSLTVVGFSTETDIIQYDGKYVSVRGQVQFLDEDDHSFATAWKSEDGSVKSEQIVWTAKWWFYDQGDAQWGVRERGLQNYDNEIEYRYIVKINGASVATYPASGYYSLTTHLSNVPNKVWVSQNLETGSYYVRGQQFGEIQVFLECSFILSHQNIILDWVNDESVDWKVMSKDGAYLKSGDSTLRLGGALPDVIEEGQNVEFYMKTGFTHGTGHDVFIYPPGGKPKVTFSGNGFTGQDNFEKTCTFKIPVGWFIEGGDNEVKIELHNRLWMESKTTFFVIDKAELAPTLVELSWNTDYKSGSTVIVNALAEPNPTTASPVNYFRVYAYFGAPGTLPGTDFQSEYIINGIDYPASAGAVQFSFNIPEGRGDTLSVKVNAVDMAGRASIGQWKSMNVINTNDPDDDGGDEGGKVHYPFVWNVEAIIIAVIGSLACVALFIIPPFWPIAPWKIIGAIIIAILTALLCYLAGTLQLPYVTGAVIAYAEYLSATWGV
jgi:hypothetical protein